MNIFLPEENIYDSVKSLDDKRLNKQIAECKTILGVALDGKLGYSYHPVTIYYKDYPWFVCKYGIVACVEYWNRFDKIHKSYEWFDKKSEEIDIGEVEPKPFYCEGLITDPNHIRTTENTVKLFRQKLCKKWNESNPKWTNRKQPKWYKGGIYEL